MFFASPPALPEPLTWREIYASRGFAGRRTKWDSQFISDAEKRGHRLGIGSKQLEVLDLSGALRPVAFRKTASLGDFADPTRDLQYLTFRDETETADWSTHAWLPDEYPHVSADYSPWQLLYVDKALELRNMSFGLDIFEAGAEELTQIVGRWKPWRDAQHEAWTELDAEWRPLIKLLVVLQSRFYPQVTGRTRLQSEFVDGQPQQVDVYEAARAGWNSRATAQRLQVSADDLCKVFWFLVERGIDFEPQDGFCTERRVALRSQVDRWRGPARIAQDHFDAAEVIRQFIIDLTGSAPGRVPQWPMDGRQSEREMLYDQGPATRADRSRRLKVAKARATYPHRVHAVVEGESEIAFIERLAENFVGIGAGEGLTFTNLHGTGGAKKIPERLGTFQPMVKRAVLVVDAEGEFPKVAGNLVDKGLLSADDLHLANGSLEEDNATPDELVAIAQSFADEDRLTLKLTGQELQARFEDQRERVGKNAKGLAEVLIAMAGDPARGGPVRFDKPLFGERLADLVARDFVESGAEGRDAVLARRPLLRFFLRRIANELRP